MNTNNVPATQSNSLKRGSETMGSLREFYIETNSFAAPFVSDSGHMYVEAHDAKSALLLAAERYRHPCGLYAATAYSSSDARNKGEKPLARWLSNHARALEGATAIRSEGPGRVEIDGVMTDIADPKAGRCDD